MRPTTDPWRLCSTSVAIVAASRQRPRWTWVSAWQASIYSRRMSMSCSVA
jgi:hypothetical protein